MAWVNTKNCPTKQSYSQHCMPEPSDHPKTSSLGGTTVALVTLRSTGTDLPPSTMSLIRLCRVNILRRAGEKPDYGMGSRWSPGAICSSHANGVGAVWTLWRKGLGLVHHCEDQSYNGTVKPAIRLRFSLYLIWLSQYTGRDPYGTVEGAKRNNNSSESFSQPWQPQAKWTANYWVYVFRWLLYV